MSKIVKCKDSKLFGVCCGLGRYMGIDPTLLRIAFIIGTIMTGSLLFWVYLVMAIAMPKEET
jgi:phage shock protein C|tara:strand:+ start:924 stop:1109 length:186 start_codon:yes stop_codon:yes gene_type:complete